MIVHSAVTTVPLRDRARVAGLARLRPEPKKQRRRPARRWRQWEWVRGAWWVGEPNGGVAPCSRAVAPPAGSSELPPGCADERIEPSEQHEAAAEKAEELTFVGGLLLSLHSRTTRSDSLAPHSVCRCRRVCCPLRLCAVRVLICRCRLHSSPLPLCHHACRHAIDAHGHHAPPRVPHQHR
jgi:hypothetical protein